jgi:peptide/nickel transport system permease protein
VIDPVEGTLVPSPAGTPIPGAGGPVSNAPSRRTRAKQLARGLLRSKTFMIGFVVIAWWIFDAIFWRAIVPFDPGAIDPASPLQSPSGEHWFGTDNFGRDVFSRVLAGASTVIVVAFAATALGIVGGTLIGLVTGYYRGIVDDVVMRTVDALLAFPVVVIATLILAAAGTSQLNLIVVIGILFMPLIARTVRSAVLSEREREYVVAARLRGESGLYIMGAEILPNVTAPIVVEASIRFGYAVFTSATLSFLGLGIQQPSPDWGLTISLGRVYVQTAPWIVLFPALALATLVVAINLLADGLRSVVEE